MSNLYFKGDNIFLYVQFVNDQGQACSVSNPRVRILHDKNGTIYEDLAWTKMTPMNENEYFYNFLIPFNTDLGQYEVIYTGDIGESQARIAETFYVITQSNNYENAIKIYGNVNDIRTNVQLSDVRIQIWDNTNINSIGEHEYISQSLSNNDGYWESFIYPGDYKFTFSKTGFNIMDIFVQIGDEQNEMQFNNIGLESLQSQNKGNGMYPITDKYVTKYGISLSNLNVQIMNTLNPTQLIAQDITDKDGQWQCFLDSGVYLLKVTGKSFNSEFDKKFRIKVDDNGRYVFEDLSKNIATTNYIDNGDESLPILTDYVKDKNGNAIIDVQVNAFKINSQLTDNNIIAQDYTDVTGKWELHLESGQYVIEYYHPQFKSFTENRTI